MNEKKFLTLNLMKGQVILIHLMSGQIICGAYKGNFSTEKCEFDFENHKTDRVEGVQLGNIDMLVT